MLRRVGVDKGDGQPGARGFKRGDHAGQTAADNDKIGLNDRHRPPFAWMVGRRQKSAPGAAPHWHNAINPPAARTGCGRVFGLFSWLWSRSVKPATFRRLKIGRASCRERGEL